MQAYFTAGPGYRERLQSYGIRKPTTVELELNNNLKDPFFDLWLVVNYSRFLSRIDTKRGFGVVTGVPPENLVLKRSSIYRNPIASTFKKESHELI